MKKATIFLFSVFIFVSSHACLNEYRTLLDGTVIYTDPTSGKVWKKEINIAELTLKAQKLWEDYERTDSLEYLSDYGVTLVYLGQYQKAKDIYFQIEKATPDLYTTASNLGTIYELMGQPDSALIWISKSVALNPDSHKGSEWIHIKILEFKISKFQDYTSSILGLYFGSDPIPSNPNNLELHKISNDIWYQIKERSNFIKPKDLIMGNLYFDLGNILAQTQDVQSALESYGAAKEYGYENKLMEIRIQKMETLADLAENKGSKERTFRLFRGIMPEIILVLAIVLMIVPALTMAWFFVKRKP